MTNSSIAWQWKTQYNLTVTAGPNGSVDTGTGWYDSGSNLVITASPTNNYRFVQWVGDFAPALATDNPLSVTMNQARNLFAQFAPITNELVVVSPYGTPNPGVGTNNFNQGTPISAGVPDSPVVNGSTQYVALGWTGTGSVPPSGSTTNTGFTIMTNSSITWQWKTQYNLTATAGPNGSIDVGSGWYDSGLESGDHGNTDE